MLFRSPLVSARNEYAYLLCALGAGTAATKADELQRIVAAGVYWKRVLRRARLHGVASLLCDALKSQPRGAVPPFATVWLEEYRSETVSRSIFLTAYLARIVDRFKVDGISSIPFKGPTLAALAYGELGLREFFDLDILVRSDDVRQASAALVSLGFRPQIELPAHLEHTFFEAENALAFRHETDGCAVELHWALTPKYLPFLRDPDTVWQSVTEANPGGRSIPTLGPERLLLFLCVHGAKHCWERLNWVCDVARLIDGRVPLNWGGLLAEADLSGSRRMLFVGILLARDLLGAGLPDAVAGTIEADAAAGRLARDLGRYIVTDEHRFMGSGRRLGLHLRLRERLRDRVGYAIHAALTPSVRDFESIRLPKYLSIMYLPMRPFRLLREYAGHWKRS